MFILHNNHITTIISGNKRLIPLKKHFYVKITYTKLDKTDYKND